MNSKISRVVLDTDVLMDFLRGKQLAINWVKKLSSEGKVLGTTAVNIFELSWSACRIGRLKDVEDLIDTLTVLDLTSREALKASEEIAYLHSLRIPIDLKDLLIGAIARLLTTVYMVKCLVLN